MKESELDKKKILGLLAALGAVAGWAISFVCVEALQKDFSSQEILFLQYFIACLVLLPFHFKDFRRSSACCLRQSSSERRSRRPCSSAAR